MSTYSQNLSTLRATVRDIVNQPTNKFLTDSTINRFLNVAQHEICKYTEALVGTENPSIVTSQAAYSLPLDWLKTISVQYQITPASSAEYQVLIPISRDEYLNLRTITTSSRPTHFAIYGGSIYIYPTPTGTADKYYHTYVKQPQQLSGDTDIPFNGETHLYAYHQELADLAVNLIRARDNGLTSEEALNAFMSRMENMKRQLSSKHKPGSGQVKRRHTLGGYKPPWPTLPSNY